MKKLVEMHGGEIEARSHGIGAGAEFIVRLPAAESPPNADGIDAGRRIRAERGDKPLLLVALTGWGQEGDRQRSKDSGFDVHMVKPVDPATLTRLLEQGPSAGH